MAAHAIPGPRGRTPVRWPGPELVGHNPRGFDQRDRDTRKGFTRTSFTAGRVNQ
jgi:hypothetical protein